MPCFQKRCYLQDMMQDLREQTLHSSPFKYGFIALVCLGFTAGGIWMCALGEWTGYGCVAFFGLGLIVILIQMLPGASYLKLTAEGFEFASMFRQHTVKWNDIGEMGVWTMRRGLAKTQMVCFNYRTALSHSSRARKLSRQISGFEGGLPDTYGLNADELLELMKQYWDAARDGKWSDADDGPDNGAWRF